MCIRTNFVSVVAVFLITAAAVAQSPDTLWTQTFGGAQEDLGGCVQLTNDGGLIVVGYTQSCGAGGYDVWLIKTDSDGNLDWDRTFGGEGDDLGHYVQQTDDGGFIIIGFTDSYGVGGYDIWLIKTDSGGNEQWSRTFGGVEDDKGHRVVLTDDGGYIIGGETISYGSGGRDFWLIKTNSGGGEQWSRTFGGIASDYCHGVEQTEDGGYILAGPTSSSGAGGSDFWLIKTDSAGYEQWDRNFGGTLDDNCHAVRQTEDGGYVLAGCSWSFGAGGCDYLLIKTDAQGYEHWSATFGGIACDCCYDVQPTTDGGYILAGWSYSYGSGGCDFWAVKTDPLGDEMWNLPIGGSGDDHGQSVRQTDDGGYIMAGHTYSFGAGDKDVWLVRLESQSLSVVLIPQNPPITLPAGGGTFGFTIEIANRSDSTAIFDAWIDATLPDGNIFGPIFQRQDLSLASQNSLSRQMTQRVGGSAPGGEYHYNAYIGLFPDDIWDQSSFGFVKEGDDPIGCLMSSDNWQILGMENGNGTNETSTAISFSVLYCYPNPFNPTTTISYRLPALSFVNLAVYDVSGRKVAELVNGWREAGRHEVTFDGSNLASGVYIYRVEAGEFTAVKKMVLVK